MCPGGMSPKSRKFWEFEVNIMKKKTIMRAVIGFPIGVTIGYFITIFISLFFADGYYAPCVPELIETAGNEIRAVLLQAVLCGVLGAGFAASSVIWEIESWGLAKQTGVYFIAISLIMLPIAYVTYWMEHSVRGFLSYFGVFVAIFVIIYVIELLIGKRVIKRMNDKLPNVKRK